MSHLHDASISYGPHLLGDLPGCSPPRMRDGEFIYRFMQELVSVAGMKPIGSPHLDLYTGPHEAWEGFSATVHIQTSHITAHFFAFGFVFLDLFSCQPFDVARVKQHIIRALEPTGRVSWRELERGHNFPHELVAPEQASALRSKAPRERRSAAR